jgi:preprotein translocase subunit SecA
MFKLFSGILDSNEKEIKRMQPYVESVNELEPEFEKLSDAELMAKTAEFKARVKQSIESIQPRLEEAQNVLAEARKNAAGATWDVEKDEAAKQYQQAQDRIKKLDEDRRKLQNEALNDILPEAFAAVRESAKRAIGQRAFDVQLLGAITLHQGKIAEMRTGEGKTLTATFPLYLNALTGRGAHLVTVNDYLARFHAYWMGPIFHRLGLSVSAIYPMQTPDEHQPARLYEPDYDSGKETDPWRKYLKPISRKEAYEADITYGTAAEFGFDFLRDNMVVDLKNCVQRPLYYAIVDEVDNLLIDEARTPLIISAASQEDYEPVYNSIGSVVSRMKSKVLPYESRDAAGKEDIEKLRGEYDYIAFEKDHYAEATVMGQEKLARALHMRSAELFGGEEYDESKTVSYEEEKKRDTILSIFRNTMIAHALYHADKEYVVDRESGKAEIVIIDEFTGRKMYGRRYSEGLHQAIEAKEHIKVQKESMTYATITIQNYFRMYEKLGGMTGTALTEAEEFFKIYKLDVTEIPTNKPMIREDLQDQIYKTEKGKVNAVVNEIKRIHDTGAPVLIGTVSIDTSVKLSDMLRRQGVQCQVLNAKEHTREANIVAKAGELGAVTVATNMAGRGVDIILGGRSPDKPVADDPALLNNYEKELADWQVKHDKVLELGGLYIIGTERHEARRIDNQLRGRAGRQGDPGSSRFYVSLEDDIMRRFGAERIKSVMGFLGMDEDTPIENKLITNSITDVQKRVEGYHFDIRKNLVEYDDVVNKHRELIYEERRKILSGADLKTNIIKMVCEEVSAIVNAHAPDKFGENRNDAGMLAEIKRIIPLPPTFTDKTLEGKPNDEIEKLFIDMVNSIYEQREKEMGEAKMRLLERLIMLQIIDRAWVNHLTEMEQMRMQAGWATLQQVKSVDAYKNAGYKQFQMLLETIKHEISVMIFHVSITERTQSKAPQSPMEKADTGSKGDAKPRQSAKVGRNDPCPCGSGKKYKHCHGK